MSTTGYIKLYRDIQSHWLWSEYKPFDRRSAWIDLLLLANHKDNKMLFNGKLEMIERGSFLTSYATLSKRWDWGTKQVRLFLQLLLQDGMITKIATNTATKLTICNYNAYQDFGADEQACKGQSEGMQGATNNNDKNVKNNLKEKIYKKEKPQRLVIPPEIEWVKAYCQDRQNGIDVQTFIDSYEAKGWMIGKSKMKDWQAAIRTWEKNGKLKDKPKTAAEIYGRYK